MSNCSSDTSSQSHLDHVPPINNAKFSIPVVLLQLLEQAKEIMKETVDGHLAHNTHTHTSRLLHID